MQPRTLFTQAAEIAGVRFSGPAIRYRRPEFLFYRQRVQPFSTWPCLHQVESSISTHRQQNIDDQFVPLVAGNGDREQAASGKDRENRSWKEKRLAENDEWEAEVEITAPSVTIEGSAITGEHLSDGYTESCTPDQSEMSLRQCKQDDARTHLPLDPVKAQQPITSRTASRLARKERRLQEGTHPGIGREVGKLGDKGSGMKEHDKDMESALKKLETMDGPPLLSKQPRKIPEKPTLEQDGTIKDATGKGTVKPSTDNTPKAAETTTQSKKLKAEPWQVRKAALEAKFGSAGWQPRKRLSPDTLDGIRALHKSDPISYSTATLSEHFKITPEAIRRILKSKWRPSEDEAEDRRQRWEKRGRKKWEDMAEKGVKPPVKWRVMGVKSPAARARESDRGSGDRHVRWDDR